MLEFKGNLKKCQYKSEEPSLLTTTALERLLRFFEGLARTEWIRHQQCK
jgi:hypothetical protein